jgi:hypothetical protein
MSTDIGIGLGMLIASALVQLGWEPRVLPYLVLLALTAAAFTGAWFMPETVEDRSRLRLTIARPHVPASARRPFLLAGLAVVASWSIGAISFSLGPQLASHLFHSTNAVVEGIGIVVLSVTGAVVGLLTGRSTPWKATSLGAIALAAGILVIVVAAGTDSGTTYLVGSVLGGIGFGAAFLGGLRALIAAIPPDHRASVMSAFYVVAYSSLSIPAVIAGIAVTAISLEATFEIFGSVVAVIALVVAFEARRQRVTPRLRNQAPIES